MELSRFYRFIQEKLKNITVPVALHAHKSEAPIESIFHPKSKVAAPASNLIDIRYIYCDKMFGKDKISAKTTKSKINPDTYTMRNLQGYIAEEERIDVCEFTVELFSKEGYPLNINNSTSEGR